MAQVVAIHNGVNEQAWRHVLAWESLHDCDCPGGPKLLRFQGRPKDYSPKARLLNLLVRRGRSGSCTATRGGAPAPRGGGGGAARPCAATRKGCGLLCILL
jgi:hypothetical protein